MKLLQSTAFCTALILVIVEHVEVHASGTANNTNSKPAHGGIGLVDLKTEPFYDGLKIFDNGTWFVIFDEYHSQGLLNDDHICRQKLGFDYTADSYYYEYDCNGTALLHYNYSCFANDSVTAQSMTFPNVETTSCVCLKPCGTRVGIRCLYSPSLDIFGCGFGSGSSNVAVRSFFTVLGLFLLILIFVCCARCKYKQPRVASIKSSQIADADLPPSYDIVASSDATNVSQLEDCEQPPPSYDAVLSKHGQTCGTEGNNVLQYTIADTEPNIPPPGYGSWF